MYGFSRENHPTRLEHMDKLLAFSSCTHLRSVLLWCIWNRPIPPPKCCRPTQSRGWWITTHDKHETWKLMWLYGFPRMYQARERERDKETERDIICIGPLIPRAGWLGKDHLELLLRVITMWQTWNIKTNVIARLYKNAPRRREKERQKQRQNSWKNMPPSPENGHFQMLPQCCRPHQRSYWSQMDSWDWDLAQNLRDTHESMVSDVVRSVQISRFKIGFALQQTAISCSPSVPLLLERSVSKLSTVYIGV